MGVIINRREEIHAASLPPEIADASTLVKKTDYATASKAGVVKVGTNIDVSSGKISVPAASDETAGVVKIGTGLAVDEDGALNVTATGGVTVDELWNGTVTSTSSDISAAMTAPYSDYKLLQFVISGANATAGQMLPVSAMVEGSAVANNVYIGTNTAIVVKLYDDGFYINSGASVTNVKIYGIK